MSFVTVTGHRERYNVSKVRNTATVCGCSPAGGVKALPGRSRYGRFMASPFLVPIRAYFSSGDI
ncbi:MAG: hypothetical protein RMZ42_28345 [Nostoc sp. DedQUE05]|uniref:hypothetical protein n=1 Tax=Nostoc sp. DedQUE05 TaxID=3075391 RepID=UPI002AD47C91|nr:hypothetical protein [Nostoc sp. DedQUE05]MDZ8095821.1 hypothetical protein [Nostoc sp. DedQUE05]